MIINILKKDDGEVYYVLNDKQIDFDYDGLSEFIERFYSNDEKVDIECDEELNEYKKLLNSILIECRKEDYVNAVRDALHSSEELALQERVLDSYMEQSNEERVTKEQKD